ncbi:MAG: hypothetical protein AVDCRST_MAG89-407, partial [uncultured Gemmatimonadetes bacterium]
VGALHFVRHLAWPLRRWCRLRPRPDERRGPDRARRMAAGL